jgi:hypothetical protein
MIKNFLFSLSLAIMCILGAHADDYAQEDPFDFDNFAIADSTDADITTASHSINAGKMPAAVGTFDIAGIMLGMTFDDVHTLIANGGLYAPRANDSIVYTIAPDWRYNLDYECRQQNIFVPDQLEQCIRTLAQNRGLMYASEYHLVRELTGETITVYFTSNATDNKVWRVEYNNDVNEMEGTAEKFADQRQKKILNFWAGVVDKYGVPNSGTDKWVTSNNSYDPMMTAYYGALDLVDNGRRASDAAVNVTGARENFPSKPYAF